MNEYARALPRNALREVAGEAGCTPAQAAIAWMCARPQPPVVVPIVAATRAEQLVSNIGALDVALEPGQLERLDRAGAPELGFPRSFLESDGVRSLIYGDTRAKLVA